MFIFRGLGMPSVTKILRKAVFLHARMEVLQLHEFSETGLYGFVIFFSLYE